MIAEGEFIDDQALQSREVFETIAKPSSVRVPVPLCVSWRKLEGMCKLSNTKSYVWQDTHEAGESHYNTILARQLLPSRLLRTIYHVILRSEV